MNLKDYVVDAIGHLGGRAKKSDIVNRVMKVYDNTSPSSISNELSRMNKRGDITRVKQGVYALPGDQEDEEAQRRPRRVEVMETDTTVGAGSHNGTAIKEQTIARYEIDYIPLDDVPDRNPRDAFLTRVIGESMEPEFSSGCQIVVEPVPEGTRYIKRDGIYVFTFEDGTEIKQLERRPGGRVICKAINERYGSFEIDTTDPNTRFSIEGRVWGKFRRY